MFLTAYNWITTTLQIQIKASPWPTDCVKIKPWFPSQGHKTRRNGKLSEWSAYLEGAALRLSTVRPVVSMLWMTRWSNTIFCFALSTIVSSTLCFVTSRYTLTCHNVQVWITTVTVRPTSADQSPADIMHTPLISHLSLSLSSPTPSPPLNPSPPLLPATLLPLTCPWHIMQNGLKSTAHQA